MKNSFIRKPISILLSLLMVLSVFGGMAFTASAATTVTWSGSGLPTGDYTDENGISVSGGTLYSHGYHDWSGDIKFTAPSGMVFTDISINHMDTDNGGTTTWHWYGNASEVDLYESMYEVSSVTFTLEQAKDPAVKNVESLIDAIGTVALTDDCKAKIDAAEAAYDALSDAQKASVTNAQKLTDAVAQYARLEGYAERLVEITNHGAVLGDLGFSSNMQYWGIEISRADAVALAQYLSAQNAGAACAVLYQEEDEYVLYYVKNNGAGGDRTSFDDYSLNDFLNGYKVYYVSLRHPAVMNVESLIDAIGTVEYTDACKAKIDAAKSAYDALTDAQKANVTNAQKLTDAIAEYNELMLNAFKSYRMDKAMDFKMSLEEAVAGDSELEEALDQAQNAIAEVQFDQSKTMDENKAAVDAAVTAKTAEINDLIAAKALAAAKAAAKAELATYKNAADYRTAEQAQLAAAIETGNTNIEAATDIDAVNTALANAKLALDAIKTDAQLTAEELEAAKTAAKSALASYKSADAYRDAQKTELASAIEAGNTDIDAAADTDAVETALAAAKTAIDAIKTAAELTAEELEAAKLAAKAELAAYKNPADYKEAQQAELAAAVAAGSRAIDAAADKAAVEAALSDAKAALDAIKTAAELTEPTDEPSDPTDEPSTPDTPDTPSDEKEVKTGNSFLYNIIKAVVDFIVSLFTKVLPAAMKLK
ncbi:MAG: surface glycoprotein [Clostridia bacterium]|nr:surface glycoprotein [Clostridia bacterium]